MLLDTDLAPKSAPSEPASPLKTVAIVFALLAVALLLVYGLWLLAPSGG
jgi:hypothetical protein